MALTKRQKQVLDFIANFVDENGYCPSYEEIASVMNCPVGTVRSRIFRARDAIAAELRPLLGTEKDRRW